MDYSHIAKQFMEERRTGKTVHILGIPCEVILWRHSGSKGRFRKAYKFTVPGWEPCTVTSEAAAERTIRGRMDAAVRNTMNII